MTFHKPSTEKKMLVDEMIDAINISLLDRGFELAPTMTLV